MRLVIRKDEILLIEKNMLSKIETIYSELRVIEQLKQKLIWEGKAYNSYVKIIN